MPDVIHSRIDIPILARRNFHIKTPSQIKEMLKDGIETKIIYIHIPFMAAWESWLSGDYTNRLKNEAFEDEVMEFRNFGQEDCDLYIEFDGTTCLNDIALDIEDYINTWEQNKMM